MALPVGLRFPDRRRVRRVIETGERIMTPLGRVIIAPVPNGRGRVLFVVSKIVSKKSSERNRIKRYLDEWVRRQHIPALGERDIVVFVSPSSVSLPVKSLRLRAHAMVNRIHTHFRQ